MGNCLVTKLKKNVNNESLPVFDTLNLYSYNNNYGQLWAYEANKSILELTDNVDPFTTIDGNVIDSTHMYVPLSGGATYYKRTQAGKSMRFTVKGKSNLKQIANFALYIEDIIYVPVQHLELSANFMPDGLIFKYNLADFSKIEDKSKLQYLKIESPSVSYSLGDISNLAAFPNLNTIRLLKSRCTGNIGDLTSLPLTMLELSNSSDIEDSVDTLAAELASNKNNGDTLTITGNGKITFKLNGDGTGDDTVIANGTVKTVTFDGTGSYSIA